MTKEEVIKEAWGKNYEVFKEHIDKNGWAKYPNFQKHEMVEDVRPIEFRSQRSDFRPKSLQGIEANNGWIRIESEEDLPKDSFNYYAFCSNGSVMTFNDFEYYKKYIIPELKATHYQPIVKPLPPLY